MLPKIANMRRHIRDFLRITKAGHVGQRLDDAADEELGSPDTDTKRSNGRIIERAIKPFNNGIMSRGGK